MRWPSPRSFLSRQAVLVTRIRRELRVYRRVLRHPRTPRRARWLLALALGYLCLPFDLIPDWIPGLGLLDDGLIVPGLIYLALRAIPPEVVAECRAAEEETAK